MTVPEVIAGQLRKLVEGAPRELLVPLAAECVAAREVAHLRLRDVEVAAPAPTVPDLLTPDGVAQALGFSRPKVLDLFRRGAFKGAFKDGKAIRIPRPALEAYKAARSKER